ncbi:hypothetical protein [Streptomyces atriruber]|uniref:hypothetical protein n=1 Tax=Streptomyces atriruber TaxID=545121 RepID=UPI000B1D3E3F|nr:hypothetical protein [Streptomyces atriruber]
MYCTPLKPRADVAALLRTAELELTERAVLDQGGSPRPFPEREPLRLVWPR